MTFHSIIHDSALFLRHNIQFVAFGITAVTVTLIGPYINGTVKRISASLHWLIRYVLFVLLCTLGYGFLTQVLYFWLKKWIIRLPDIHLLIWTSLIYLGLAWFAKQQKEI
ncbi:MAG TPA: DUF3392 family protein [Chitinispirillaceae bacterium]|nr:DUF3392 family protein [Chitinispirillaceae bacterium]